MGQYYRSVGRQTPVQLRGRTQGTCLQRGSSEAVETAEHLTTATAQDSGEVVMDRYRLLRRLGGGGFGVVWLAHDLKLDRTVAVKRIPAPDAETAKRAQREGVAAARLQHPAIVALHEAGSDEENVYLVSELVRGATFARLLEEGALSDRDLGEIGGPPRDALAHANKRGIIHRDVKPLNILVPDAAGDGGAPAKLTDFGVARIAGDDALTRTGDVVGTLAYMAPEQAEGAEVGEPADLYALGLCLYEGLSGVNPLRARGAGATARRIGQRLPPLGRLRRDLPLELCGAIDAAVWPHADERGTIADLRAALAGALQDVDDEPGTIAGGPLEPLAGGAPPPPPPPPPRAPAPPPAPPAARAAPRRGGPGAPTTPPPAARAPPPPPCMPRAPRPRRPKRPSRRPWPRSPARWSPPSPRWRCRAWPGSSSPPRSPSGWPAPRPTGHGWSPRPPCRCRCCCAVPPPAPGRCRRWRPCSAWPRSPAPSRRSPAGRAGRGVGRGPARWAPGGSCWPRRRCGARSCSARRPTTTAPARSAPSSPPRRSRSSPSGPRPRRCCRCSCAAG